MSNYHFADAPVINANTVDGVIEAWEAEGRPSSFGIMNEWFQGTISLWPNEVSLKGEVSGHEIMHDLALRFNEITKDMDFEEFV